MPKKTRKPPSQTWRTSLVNHFGSLASIDFFTVPTATFRVLFVFFVPVHDRRRVVHFNVTEHPGAAWTAQQIIEAFPEDTVPRYIVRNRDGIYGDYFCRRVESRTTTWRRTALSGALARWRCRWWSSTRRSRAGRC